MTTHDLELLSLRHWVITSPLGALEIGIEAKTLKTLRYKGELAQAESTRAGNNARRAQVSGQVDQVDANFLREVESQLRHYFKDPKWRFDLPFELEGTPFQRRVWAELEQIPSGVVMTYGDVAQRLGSGARAVGGACRSNPLPIIIPCHRVVAAAGVGGYCGSMRGKMLLAKQWLLRHESC